MKSLVEKVANAMNKAKESAFLGENVVLNQAKVQEQNIESAKNAAEKWGKEIAQIAQVAHNQSGFDVQIGQWDADGLDELAKAKENEKKNLRKALCAELKAALSDDFVLDNIRKKSIKNSAKKPSFGEEAELKIANLIESSRADSIESCVADSIESFDNSPHFVRDSSLRASHSAMNDKIGASHFAMNDKIGASHSAMNDKRADSIYDEMPRRHSEQSEESSAAFLADSLDLNSSLRASEFEIESSNLDSIELNSILLEIEESAQIRLLNGTADDKAALIEAENIIKKAIKAQNEEQADFLCLCRASNAERLETMSNALISQSERLLCFMPQNPKTANYFIAAAREFCAALWLFSERAKDFVESTLKAYAPLLLDSIKLDSINLDSINKAELKNALITIAAFYQRKSGYNSDIAELNSNLHISHSGVNEMLGGGLCINAEISLNDRISEFCFKNLFSKDELEISANELEIALESDYYKDDEVGFVSAFAAVNFPKGVANSQEWEITAHTRDELSLEFNSTTLRGARQYDGFISDLGGELSTELSSDFVLDSMLQENKGNEIFALNEIISNGEIFALESLKLGLNLAEYSENFGASCSSYTLKAAHKEPSGLKCILKYSINGENSELDIICRDIFEKIEQKNIERRMQKAA